MLGAHRDAAAARHAVSALRSRFTRRRPSASGWASGPTARWSSAGRGLQLGPDSEDGPFHPLNRDEVRIRHVDDGLEVDGEPVAGRGALPHLRRRARAPGREHRRPWRGRRRPARQEGAPGQRPPPRGLRGRGPRRGDAGHLSHGGAQGPGRRRPDLRAQQEAGGPLRAGAPRKQRPGPGLRRAEPREPPHPRRHRGHRRTGPHLGAGPHRGLLPFLVRGPHRDRAGRHLGRDLPYLEERGLQLQARPATPAGRSTSPPTSWSGPSAPAASSRSSPAPPPAGCGASRSAAGACPASSSASASATTRCAHSASRSRPTRRGGARLTGRGFGHGAGLSQWGAHAMAEDGKDYRAILAHFYPDTELQTLY